MLLREHGPAGCNSTNQRQAHLLTKRVFQLDAARGAGQQVEHTLLCSARRCSSAAFGDLKPIAAAISARVGGMPLSMMESWIILRIWRWRGVRSVIGFPCTEIQLLCLYTELRARPQECDVAHNVMSRPLPSIRAPRPLVGAGCPGAALRARCAPWRRDTSRDSTCSN